VAQGDEAGGGRPRGVAGPPRRPGSSDARGVPALGRGRLPEGWEKPLLTYKKAQVEAQPERSNIQTSGEISRVLSHAIPELVGGAPDLEAATQHKRDMQPFTAANRIGRYIHYGVREHAMGAMMMAWSPTKASCPSVSPSSSSRTTCACDAAFGDDVAAGDLGIQPRFHRIGTNGPTHQPVEHLPSLRAYRISGSCDLATLSRRAECWHWRSRTGPPVGDRQFPATAEDPAHELRRGNLCAKGAYIMATP